MVNIQCPKQTFTGVKALIFDKDGTLARSEPYLLSLAQRRAQFVAAQVPGTEALLLSAFGATANQINPAGLMAVGSRQESLIGAAAYVTAQGHSWMAALTIVEHAFAAADQALPVKASQTQPIAGTLAALTHYHQQGLKLAVISADIAANIQAFLNQYQLAPLISAIAGADQPPSKPDPDCFRRVCQQPGVQPQQALMVGDSEADLRMAQGANALGTIGVTWAWAIAPQLPTADVVLNTWQDLLILVD
ncbi:MAG: HAD family hydrolase [Cyanobacteria bacterium P01_H01_bin.121]